MAVYIGSKKVGRDALTARESRIAQKAGASSSDISSSRSQSLNLSDEQEDILIKENIPRSKWSEVVWVSGETLTKMKAYATVSGGTAIVDGKIYLRKDRVIESLAQETTRAKLTEALERERITQQWEKKKFIENAAEDTRKTHELYITQKRGQSGSDLVSFKTTPNDYLYSGNLQPKISRSSSPQESFVPLEYQRQGTSIMKVPKEKGLYRAATKEESMAMVTGELRQIWKDAFSPVNTGIGPVKGAVAFVGVNTAYAGQVAYSVVSRPKETALSLVNAESYIEGAGMLIGKVATLDPTLATDVLIMKGTGKLGGAALKKTASLIEKTPLYEPPSFALDTVSQTNRKIFVTDDTVFDTTSFSGGKKGLKVEGEVVEIWRMAPEGKGYTSKIYGELKVSSKKQTQQVSISGLSNTYYISDSSAVKIVDTTALIKGKKNSKIIGSRDITAVNQKPTEIITELSFGKGVRSSPKQTSEYPFAYLKKGLTDESIIKQSGAKTALYETTKITQPKGMQGITGMKGESFGFETGRINIKTKQLNPDLVKSSVFDLKSSKYRSYTAFDSTMILESTRSTGITIKPEIYSKTTKKRINVTSQEYPFAYMREGYSYEGSNAGVPQIMRTTTEGKLGFVIEEGPAITDQLWYSAARARSTGSKAGIEIKPIARGLEIVQKPTFKSAAKAFWADERGQLLPKDSPATAKTTRIVGETGSGFADRLIDTKDYVQRYLGEATKEPITEFKLAPRGSLKLSDRQITSQGFEVNVERPGVSERLFEVPSSRSMEVLSIKSFTGLSSAQRPISELGYVSDLRPMTSTKSLTGQKAMTSTKAISVQTFSNPMFSGSIVVPPIETPPPTPIYSPPAPYFGFGGFSTPARPVNYKTKYVASVEAVLFNIRGAAPKNITGLELRPLGGKNGRRKRSKR